MEGATPRGLWRHRGHRLGPSLRHELGLTTEEALDASLALYVLVVYVKGGSSSTPRPVPVEGENGGLLAVPAAEDPPLDSGKPKRVVCGQALGRVADALERKIRVFLSTFKVVRAVVSILLIGLMMGVLVGCAWRLASMWVIALPVSTLGLIAIFHGIKSQKGDTISVRVYCFWTFGGRTVSNHYFSAYHSSFSPLRFIHLQICQKKNRF